MGRMAGMSVFDDFFPSVNEHNETRKMVAQFTSALVGLLIHKGVFTLVEWRNAVIRTGAIVDQEWQAKKEREANEP